VATNGHTFNPTIENPNCALFERIVDDTNRSGENLECRHQALLRPAAKVDGTPLPSGAADGP
jgi:hypothetical protein